MSDQSDTPRTQVGIDDWINTGEISVLGDIAEELELELAAARAEIDMMGIRYAAAEMHHDTNMQEITEQLNKYRDQLESAISDHELSEIRNHKLTEQRDKYRNQLESAHCSPPDYDAGLLNDFGGGNVGWWQDYLRAEIGRANDYWRGIYD